MIKKLKSNKLLSYMLIIMCFIIIFNPTIYAKACLNAISVWSVNVLPLLFPFFIITRIITNLNTPKPNIMDKFFNKVYNAPNGSFNTFFLATLSGYPMGAKLICTMHENNYISSNDAKKMLSFCSVSGPMFMLGSVGIMMLKSYKAGLIILIANILASLINGLIYRGKKETTTSPICFITKKNENLLADSVYDSLISILMVGAYIVFSFLIIEILKNLHIISFFSNSICWVFNCKQYHNVVEACMLGLVEITRGILDLSSTSIPLGTKTIISSSLIGFGGLSIMLQNINFLNKLKIPVKHILIQKFTQALICLCLTTIFCILFLY